MKPILFSTEMVRAILDGRKTVTRRVIKPAAMGMTYTDGSPARQSPYCPGDILYIRETWCDNIDHEIYPFELEMYWYKADAPDKMLPVVPEWFRGWHSSTTMPFEAARIFLRVKEVQVRRLQEITCGEILKEGVKSKKPEWIKIDFADLWNSTIKPADIELFGWAANPWVWVIEFDRISREEAEKSDA